MKYHIKVVFDYLTKHKIDINVRLKEWNICEGGLLLFIYFILWYRKYENFL